MKQIQAFFRDVRSELKKVTWPTRQETIRMTVLVIIATVIIGLYVGAIDYGLTKMLEQFIN